MVILLESPTPVRWRVKMSGQSPQSDSGGIEDYQLSVYTSETSRLASWSPRAPDLTDTVESIVGKAGSFNASAGGGLLTNQDFFDKVASRFGAVTTFSQISDANHIIVKLSQG